MGNVVDRPLGIMRHRSDPQSGSTRRAPAPGARRRGSARPFALLVAIVVVIAGCGRTYYTPEIAGVVVANGVQVDGGGGVRLADGTGVPLGGRMRQVYGGGSPNVGDLLLTGSTPIRVTATGATSWTTNTMTAMPNALRRIAQLLTTWLAIPLVGDMGWPSKRNRHRKARKKTAPIITSRGTR